MPCHEHFFRYLPVPFSCQNAYRLPVTVRVDFTVKVEERVLTKIDELNVLFVA